MSFLNNLFAEAVKARWHTSSAGSPLAVKFIDPKAIIVPGLSGQYVVNLWRVETEPL